ncbi:MAG: CBS domain-containing protein [Desulfobulbaceae bacterium]|nr:CBS domain-containing protein [Desulfobulbaceae bacterium]
MDIQKISDILTPDVVGIAPEASISETLQLMTSKNISCVVVMEGNHPIGIVTERNMVRLVAKQWGVIRDQEVREVMSSPLVSIEGGMDIFEAYNVLFSKGLRHLVVMDGDEPSGVITLSNIIEHLTFESFVEIKRVSQVMTKIVFTVDPEIELKDALIEMSRKSMSCIIAVDGKKPLGIITERDISHLLAEDLDLSRFKVGDVMTRSLQMVNMDTPLTSAVEIMKRQRLRRLVVVGTEGNIEGLATQSDIVKGLEGKYIQALSDIIREKDSIIQRTSKDLAEKSVYLDNILQSSIDNGILAMDLDNYVTYCNPGAENILGIKAERVLGKDLRHVHGNDHCLLRKVEEVLGEIRNGEQVSFVIERFRGAEKQYINASASGIRDYAGVLQGFFLMISDVTKQKEAEEELKKAHEHLEQRVAERTAELSKAMHGAVEAMAMTVEMRDPYTSGHQRRVADLASHIAMELALSDEKVQGVYMAGVIHDIGKIRVPSDILCLPGRLSQAEFAIIAPHPTVGYDILKGIEFPWPIARIVLQHHERLDGSGYPQCLQADQILIEAKILAVADVVEAMSSHRPYRPARGVERALEEITDNSAIRYDSEAVGACVELFTKKKYQFPSHRKQSGENLMHMESIALT